MERANAAVDRLIAAHRAKEGLEENARINYLDFIGRDKEFMDLLDCPTTFPKVWNIPGLEHPALPLPPDLDPAPCSRANRTPATTGTRTAAGSTRNWRRIPSPASH